MNDSFRDFDVTIGILVEEGKTLLVERPLDAEEFPGMAGFPGGKRHEGEGVREACRTTCEVDTGMEVTVDRKLGRVQQIIEGAPERNIMIRVYEIEREGTHHLKEETFWVDIAQLDHVEVAPGNLSMFHDLYQKETGGTYRSRLERRPGGEYVQTGWVRLR